MKVLFLDCWIREKKTFVGSGCDFFVEQQHVMLDKFDRGDISYAIFIWSISNHNDKY